MTLVEQLAHYVATLRYEDIPPEVVRQTKRLLIDTVPPVLAQVMEFFSLAS